MEYKINPDYGYTATVGDVRLHVTSYEVSRMRKYKFQNVSKGQAIVGDAGTLPVYLILKGKVLKTDGVDPECCFYNDMVNNIRYFLTVDRVFFNAARLESFRAVTDMNSQYIDCELKFMCDSYIEAAIK